MTTIVLEQVRQHLQTMGLKQAVEALDGWTCEAARSGLKQFKSIARSFHQDYQAIRPALTSLWSTGQCEG